ncbi:DUF4254 domain-containing protein [Nocardia sp. NPDC004573]
MFGEGAPRRSVRDVSVVEPLLSGVSGGCRSESVDGRDASGAHRNKLPFSGIGEASRVGSNEVLPTAADLVHAIRRSGGIDHPLARWAGELAELYVQPGGELADRRDRAEQRRWTIVHDIDVWTDQHVSQHRHGAALHTETLGSVVARIADACVQADELLATVRPGDPTVHVAWCRLAELVDAYTDLIEEVLTGRRRLPAFATRA